MPALVAPAVLMAETGKLSVKSLDRGVLLAKEVLDQFPAPAALSQFVLVHSE